MRGRAKNTILLENAIGEIVTERSPITVRGICYALFSRGMIRSMARNETNRISKVTTRLREAGAIDWRMIVDDSRTVQTVSQWRDPAQIINAAVRSYRRDYWQDQPNAVEVWSEKGTVGGILQPILDEFGVAFRVMKGFGSFTALKNAAVDSAQQSKKFIAYYVGDYDASGLYMSEIDLPSRISRYGGNWDIRRVALTGNDIKSLPGFDIGTKRGDPRYRWFVERYGNVGYELDAMPPNELRDRVSGQIASSINFPAWRRAIEIEAVEVESMSDFYAEWNNRLAAS